MHVNWFSVNNVCHSEWLLNAYEMQKWCTEQSTFRTLRSVNILLLLLLLSLLLHLCRVFTIVYLKQTMFLGYTMLQLFCIYRCATYNVISPVKYIMFIIIIIIIAAAAVVFTCITTSVMYRTLGWLVLNDQLGMMCNEVTWYKVLLRNFSGQSGQHRQIASLYTESGSNSRVHSVAALLYLQFVLHVMLFRPWNIFYYSKTCLKGNLKGQEHFSAKARFPFNQGTIPV